MNARKVTKRQADRVLREVAIWLGKQGYGAAPGEPAPIGHEAAMNGDGPELNMVWDWPGSPTPTILLEGGPEDWPCSCSYDVQQVLGSDVFVEPFSSYALCIYPGD